MADGRRIRVETARAASSNINAAGRTRRVKRTPDLAVAYRLPCTNTYYITANVDGSSLRVKGGHAYDVQSGLAVFNYNSKTNPQAMGLMNLMTLTPRSALDYKYANKARP
ncbi:hypothetical protein EVAR_74796_1 [Eumeta japonica]|uniref:Uncharacterized protein n=1 Tax=Eumeta variegata TaxID=151549 RepID=A0A4C1SPZ0_EUMVA|nr:hypothetical protein EVAR_74796_1 [Eumeta japonica]